MAHAGVYLLYQGDVVAKPRRRRRHQSGRNHRIGGAAAPKHGGLGPREHLVARLRGAENEAAQHHSVGDALGAGPEQLGHHHPAL